MNRRSLDIISPDANEKKDLKVNFYQSSTLFQKQPGRMKEQESIDIPPMKSLGNSVRNDSTEKNVINLSGNSSIQSIKAKVNNSIENNKTMQPIDIDDTTRIEAIIDSTDLEKSTDSNQIQSTISALLSPYNITSSDTSLNSTTIKLVAPIMDNLINDLTTKAVNLETDDSIDNTSMKPLDLIDFMSYKVKPINPGTQESIIVNTTLRAFDHSDEDDSLIINELERKYLMEKLMKPNEIGSMMKTVATNVKNSVSNLSIESQDRDEVDSTIALGLINLGLKSYMGITPIKLMDHKKGILTTTSIFPIKEQYNMLVTERYTPIESNNSTGINGIDSEFSKQNSSLLNFEFYPTKAGDTLERKSNKGAKDLYLCDEFGCSKVTDKNLLGTYYTKTEAITEISLPTSTKKIEPNSLESTSSTKAIYSTNSKSINKIQNLVASHQNQGRQLHSPKQLHNPKQKMVSYSKTELPKATRKTSTEKSAPKKINVDKTLSEKGSYRSENIIVDQIQCLVKTQKNQGDKLDEILKQQEYLNRKLDKIISNDGLKTVPANSTIEQPPKNEYTTAIPNEIGINLTTTESYEVLSSEKTVLLQEEVSKIEYPHQGVAQKMRAIGNDSFWNSNQTSGYYLSIIKHFDKILNKNPK